jgi:hypothetical protein
MSHSLDEFGQFLLAARMRISFDLTDSENSVHKAFESNFIGDASFLCKAIRDVFSMHNEYRYSSSFSIIQSSGTDKSRLVDEMAKEFFTFPICVCDDDPVGQLCT